MSTKNLNNFIKTNKLTEEQVAQFKKCIDLNEKYLEGNYNFFPLELDKIKTSSANREFVKALAKISNCTEIILTNTNDIILALQKENEDLARKLEAENALKSVIDDVKVGANHLMTVLVGIGAHSIGFVAEKIVEHYLPNKQYSKFLIKKITHEIVEGLITSCPIINMVKGKTNIYEALINIIKPIYESPIELIFSMGSSYMLELVVSEALGLDKCCKIKFVILAPSTQHNSNDHTWNKWFYNNAIKGFASVIGSYSGSLLYEEITSIGTINEDSEHIPISNSTFSNDNCSLMGQDVCPIEDYGS